MRKLILFLSLVLFVGIETLSAQTKTITGKVVDDQGQPIPGSSIIVKGTTTGTISSPDGRYSIAVPDDATTLIFSFVGMKMQEIAIGTSTTINVTLTSDSEDIDEVVVTALGISREKKALGYAVQEVSGDELTKAKDQNIVNSLSGKISGVQVTSASGAIGSSSRITIRGNSSFSSNEPLFVVDGVPISNYSSSVSQWGSVDYGNGASDIAPENIESITVLKGANAAALYGMQAGNGVVLITTKKGKANGGFQVQVNAGVTFSDVYILPNYQNEYGQGHSGSEYIYNNSGSTDSYQNYATTNSFSYVDGKGGGVYDYYDESWGPRMDIGLMIPQFDSPYVDGEYQATEWVSHPDNVKSFFETGVTYDNSVSISNATEKGSTRLFLSRQDITGTIPNTDLKKTTFNVSNTIKPNDRFTATGALTYTQSKSDNLPGQGYDENNIMQSIGGWFGRQVDMSSLKENWNTYNENGDPYNWNSYYHNNPYWTVYNNTNSMLKDHVYGNYSLDYKLTSWLNVMGRGGIDWYRLSKKRVTYDGSIEDSYGGGAFNESKTYGREFNADLIFTYDKSLTKDLRINGSVGANYRNYYLDYMYLYASSLTVPNLFNISNVSGSVSASQTKKEIQSNSVFASMTASYHNFLFLDLTARNDWSSTLPSDEWSFFYPSVTGSWILTESLPIKSDVLSFAKLRAGWAKVGNATDPYKLSATYSAASSYNSSVTPYYLPTTGAPENLKPEDVISTEVGVEVKMFRNRLGINATYYDKVTKNQIMDIDVSDASGYDSQTINAGEVENSGVELELNGQIFKSTTGFNWDMTINWAKNKNRVNKLYEGIDTYSISSSWSSLTIEAIPGQPFGTMKGYGYLTDGDGNIVVDADGLPQAGESPEVIGCIMPDWTGGINNNFRWRNWSASFLIDMRKGGDIFSVSDWFGAQAGITAETVQKASRDGVDGNIREVGLVVGQDVLKGYNAVNEDGTPNTTVATAQDYYETSYWNTEKQGVIDGSFIKLREFTLGYSIPQSVLTKTGFLKSANVSFVGRNLALLWTDKSNDVGIDPETAFGSSMSGMGIEQYQIPATRNLGFKISLTL